MSIPAQGVVLALRGKVKFISSNLVFLIFLVLTALAVFVPFSPALPGEGLDPSWMLAMNQAIAQGLVIGSDIAFTFGPYAAIYTKAYHPATDHLMIWGAMYLGLSFALAVYRNFKNASWTMQLALLFVLGAFIYFPDALLFFYPLLVGASLYRSVAADEIEKTGTRTFAAIVVALFTPFGLLPLIKGSALVACIVIVLFSAFLLVKTGRRQLAAACCLVPVVSMMAFWSVAGQPVAALPRYFQSMLPIISGYTEAMSLSGSARELLAYAAAASAIVILVFLRKDVPLFLRSTAALMFSCVLFLAFKAGFVRHDGHAVIASTTLFLVAMLAGTLLSRYKALVLFLVAAAAWSYIDRAQIKTSPQTAFHNFKSTYLNAWTGMASRISVPGKLKEDYARSLAELNARGMVPALEGTVDIYSYDQAYLIASGNKWNPRPVLQSYSVYAPALADKNKEHLVGPNRPDNILFKVQPIDGRLPALEEGPSWPVLISDYEPSSFVNGYLLLKHRQPGSITPAQSNSVLTRTASLGEQLILPATNKALYAKINLQKSVLGSLSNTLLKPSQLEIRVTTANGIEKKYRMIASMAAAGFVLSPLVESTEDFGLLYAGTNFLKGKAVASISIEPVGRNIFWRNSFEIELFALEYKADEGVIAKYGFAQVEDRTGFGNPVLVEKCDGSIDSANGVSPAQTVVSAAALLNVNGWLALSADAAELPDKTYLMLTSEQGTRYFVETQQTERPDVGAHFHKPQLNQSGYVATADVTKLAGDYTLGLAYEKGNSMFMCPQFKMKTHIGR
ncbi:hypothetical protein [Duganella sp. Root336D2]|uniref:hypothetical protein n=1 Tax=Duganella sp. Root336D2 TaxID=1736518 RepID=UPI0006F3F270|nr:hypothetical protein [Duganella sp. Root336D2]KQV44885.1 hypothetical protein ASD07_20300 [Duganella sp. Root336D2]